MNPLLIIPATSFGLGCWQCYRLKWKLELLEQIDKQLPEKLNLDKPQKEFTLVSINGYFKPDEIRIERPKTVDAKV